MYPHACSGDLTISILAERWRFCSQCPRLCSLNCSLKRSGQGSFTPVVFQFRSDRLSHPKTWQHPEL